MSTVGARQSRAQRAGIAATDQRELGAVLDRLARWLPRAVPISEGRLQALLLLACEHDPVLAAGVQWEWAPWLPIPDPSSATALARATGLAQSNARRPLARWVAISRKDRRLAALACGPGLLMIDDLASLAREAYVARAWASAGLTTDRDSADNSDGGQKGRPTQGPR